MKFVLGSGEIEFEEFAAMVANFVVNSEDNEGLEEELREAFRLYDKEVPFVVFLWLLGQRLHQRIRFARNLEGSR